MTHMETAIEALEGVASDPSKTVRECLDDMRELQDAVRVYVESLEGDMDSLT